MSNIVDQLTQVLMSEPTFLVEGELNKNRIAALARQYDQKLLALLLSQPELTHFFFTAIGEVKVFKKDIFLQFLAQKSFLPDSYTAFRTKIGLAVNDDFIAESSQVVLNWPYKDCLLEGGQDKDDQKRSEIFFNEVLAPDRITTLLDAKVFTNWKRYDQTGESDLDQLRPDDNLIIKGNNLVVLHSLKKRFAGKIKLIYVDPPYYFAAPRPEDTFKYNSNFKLSTWLTFMKNRLEVARELLAPDGAIFVQVNDDSVAALRLLMQEIFCQDRNNFINQITVKTKSPSGFASVNPGLFETAEYILAFAKNKPAWNYHPQYIRAEFDPNYKWYVENKTDDYTNWHVVDLFEYVARANNYTSKADAIRQLGEKAFLEIVASFATTHADSVFQPTAIGAKAGREVIKARDQSKRRKGQVFRVARNQHYDIYILDGREMAFYAKKVRQLDGELVPTVQLTNIWTDVPYEGIAREGKVTLKGGKKPEKLLRRIIEMSTNPGDVVLDYHLGSGTTAAVAHKLGRQYIGIEQLYYGEDDSVTRLQKVINGDTTGISKSVCWRGGGSFVYCNVKNDANTFRERVRAADAKQLAELLREVLKSSFLSYRVDPRKVSLPEFTKLSIAEQKRILIELVDQNTLYLNYSEINDQTYYVSAADKKHNAELYG